MRILFLDLASHSGSIACVTENDAAALTPIDHRIDDAQLMPAVEEALKKAGWTYKDLTHIACVVGPGGFTSLRVGVAAGNALSYALGIPACGVHLSDLYAARVRKIQNSKLETNSSSGNSLNYSKNSPDSILFRVSDFEFCVWLHSTKKTELFLHNLNVEEEPQHVKLDELPALLKKGEWTGELLPEHEKIVTDLGLTKAELRPLEDVLPEFLASRKYGSETLIPWYGRGW